MYQSIFSPCAQRKARRCHCMPDTMATVLPQVQEQKRKFNADYPEEINALAVGPNHEGRQSLNDDVAFQEEDNIWVREGTETLILDVLPNVAGAQAKKKAKGVTNADKKKL
ncbi:hypothetical protein M9H77_23832 [Catharanthus roseus]|uniref:Uncharacterized protein n=1 Tax=Catharanthus roseus TaxID=4058 RepID=A0ACC0AUD8_CATRO|nr:hypothetical protein M9H77_23832 [Catharanthus roseus]